VGSKKWNPQRNRLLLRMYRSRRYSTGEIAERLLVSPPTVYDRLRRLGFSTSSLPRRYRAAAKVKFSEGETQKIIEFKRQGLYNTDVALKLGRTIGPINRIVRELKLPASAYKPIPEGLRFGALTIVGAVRPLRTYKGHLESRSLAKCDCGERVSVFNHALRSGNVKTCGCRITRRNADAVWVRARSNIVIGARARRHGRVNLSLAQVKAISTRSCFYCGSPASNKLKGRKRGRSTRATVLQYTGIDQVVLGRGYNLGNILPCCRICNRAKSDMSLKDFLDWLARFGAAVTANDVVNAAKTLGSQLSRLRDGDTKARSLSST
jgi:transposase